MITLTAMIFPGDADSSGRLKILPTVWVTSRDVREVGHARNRHARHAQGIQVTRRLPLFVADV
jgi:hypothetical protein